MNTAVLKQPAGLRVLFFAELWERFGFYCIQALMVLYLTQQLGYADKSAYDLFGAFSGLIYATPLIGGYLADRILGYRRAILVGAVLYIIGYFTLALVRPAFDFALAALICGNGFFKPNVSSLLGKLYSEDDPRRDSGFTWFYMGINIGSFSAPLICTYIAVHYGWHYGFMSAGIGMLLGITNCVLGFKLLGDAGRAPVKLTWAMKAFIYLGVAILLVFIASLLKYSSAVGSGLIVVEIAAFLGLVFYSFFENRVQRNKLIALVILMVFSIVFWALYVQVYYSLTLFTQRNIDRHFFGFLIPTGMFSSAIGFYIIVLSPVLATLWMKLSQSHSRYNPSTAMKFSIALVIMGLAYLLLCMGIKLTALQGLIPVIWIFMTYLLFTLGELSLSPIGLAAVTALAPPRLTGMVMGIWFISLSAAYATGNKIADLTAVPKNMVDPTQTINIYNQNFMHFGLASLGIGIVLILLSPVLRRMMEGHDTKLGPKKSENQRERLNGTRQNAMAGVEE